MGEASPRLLSMQRVSPVLALNSAVRILRMCAPMPTSIMLLRSLWMVGDNRPCESSVILNEAAI